jgi:NAD(P)-dependent dehydrogenase (short-subunit alcohol dehydrogenase family)
LSNNTSYAAAKAGVIGVARSLAVAGAEHGIKVNCIAPAAFTRMAGSGEPTPEMSPELVAPMAAFLAHEDCPVSGEIYAAGAGRFARIFIACNDGYVERAATVEDIAQNWRVINDASDFDVPADLTAWSAGFLRHLRSE